MLNYTSVSYKLKGFNCIIRSPNQRRLLNENVVNWLKLGVNGYKDTFKDHLFQKEVHCDRVECQIRKNLEDICGIYCIAEKTSTYMSPADSVAQLFVMLRSWIALRNANIYIQFS